MDDSLYHTFLDTTVLLRSRYGHIPFANYIYKNLKSSITKNTGCNDWNTFIKNQLSLPFDYILFYKLTITTETNDMKNSRISNDSLTCTNMTAVNEIIDILQISKPTSQLYSIACNEKIWHLKYCNNQGYAICVNCKNVIDLCSSTYCPSSSNLLYISPCTSCPHNGKLATRFSSYSIIDFQYTELVLYPTISNINITRSKNGFGLSLNVSQAGNIYCAASDVINDKISSTISIKQNGIKYVNVGSGYKVINMELKNLYPSTKYNIYCYTEDFSNHAMSFTSALKTVATTTCCASIIFTSLYPTVMELATTNKIFSFSLDSPPKRNTLVNVILIPDLQDCSYYDEGTRLNASEYIIPSTFVFTNRSTTLTGSFVIKGLPACYQLVAFVKQGTYSNATATIDILSSKTPPVAPILSLVQFSNDGRFLYVSFDSSTDKGVTIIKNQISFNCSQLVRFPSSSDSKCLWQNDKLIVATLSNTVQVASLPSIGDRFVLLDKVIKPLCTISYDICKKVNATLSMSLDISAPSNPTLPSVTLSTPSKIGDCNNIVIDPTRSSGKAGRPWKSCSWTISSTVDDNMNEISYNISLLRDTDKYFIIDKSYLVPPATYTFTVQVQNWMGQTALLQTKVEVTASVTMPVVSIPGSSVISMYKYQPLSIFASASVPSCGGSSVNTRVAITYTWQLFRGVQPFVKENISKDKRYFKLPINSLEPGAYTVQVTASTSPIDSSSAMVSIQVMAAGVIALLKGSDIKVFSYLDTITLDASTSSALDYPASQYPKTYLSYISFRWISMQERFL